MPVRARTEDVSVEWNLRGAILKERLLGGLSEHFGAFMLTRAVMYGEGRLSMS